MPTATDQSHQPDPLNSLNHYQQQLLDQLNNSSDARQKDLVLAIPAAYYEKFSVDQAAQDLQKLAALSEASPLIWHLYQSDDEACNRLHLQLFGREVPLMLSKILPLLENFGVSVIAAQTYEFGAIWLQDYELVLDHVETVDMAVVKPQFEGGLQEIWSGRVENDAFNELILTTRLDTYDVVVLRALARYMRQAKAPFSNAYIMQTLIKHSDISVMLFDLFAAKMTPTVDNRDSTVKKLNAQLDDQLANVERLDEEQILRWYLDLIHAMVRTNFYQTENGERKDRLSFKFLASDIPNLPKPKPMFEIFVYSPKVEAVHLRGGKVARGGLRWSDRSEDFRTEVLGLVKAQMVKNAVIVPVGSKGGFIVKSNVNANDRDAFLAEGVACYQAFLRGMLDITDNIIDGNIVPPKDVIRHDEDDPYLVVAADKGTAKFSDIANALSAEYGFWLGDAFASGGSVGYDHKAMGITARGAWESVKRHFRMIGRDIQNRDDFTVVGIGDMSGDVFGNGMLQSKHTKLLAAFNHLHIFIDPNPDCEASYQERKRLFELPRSTWEDYDKQLISQGGGVFSRADKAVSITDEMKSAFAIDADQLTPNELIHALLCAPVDLLWNGGIGTYVKSADETNNDVGDRANDAVRVNGKELNALIVGEGGNLGFTQQGRIEFARNGGRIYTDAIDNSAGVNCSDHEVNIKILLGDIIEKGQLSENDRNKLLAAMTDSVAKLVLRQNYLQPQAIELTAQNAAANLATHQRIIEQLEAENRLDRAIENLPSHEQIKRRQKSGEGLTNPEIAVVMAYGKMWVYDHILASNVPDDPYFSKELKKYFPEELVTRYFEQMQQHPLHREIISTYLTNSIVNRLGIETVFEIVEQSAQSLASIVRAYAITRDIFAISQAWQTLETLDNAVAANALLQLEIKLRSFQARAILWFVSNFNEDLKVSDMIVRFGDSASDLVKPSGFIEQHFATELSQDTQALIDQGVPSEAAKVFAMMPYRADALDVTLLAEKFKQDNAVIAPLYFEVYQQLKLDWMMAKIASLPQDSIWERRAVQALSEGLSRQVQALMQHLLAKDDPKHAFLQWQASKKSALDALQTQIDGLADSQITIAMLLVIMNEIAALNH